MYKDTELFKDIIALTSINLCKRPYLEQIERVCSYHPKALILREKDLSEKEYYILAKNVIEICKQYNVLCILHNYINVAIKLNCTAIHLPFQLLQKYYNHLKNFTKIGTSIHSIEEALKAEELGATYIIAGHIYATECKKDIPPRGIIFLENICKNTSLPVYGIGGIKLDKKQIDEVMSCGAKGVCIMSGMMKI